MDVNNCTFSGRLTKDAVQKELPTGTKLVNFDIANNVGFGEHEKVTFINVQLWGKSGDNLLKYLTKGKAVAVCGSLELQKWVSKQDGTEQKKLVLNSNNVILLHGGSKPAESEPVVETLPAETEAEYEVVF